MTKKREAASRIFRQQNQRNMVEQESEQLESSASPAPRSKKAASPGAPPPPPPLFDEDFEDGLKSSEELQLEKEPIRVRETGYWFWRRVIVPPNAYVIHTRAGRKQPVTIGLGLSFRYNPYSDAYLVVPAAMQTIGVVANCISREKQGINILAYVQWQIDDFSIAYRKLDFSDSRDPLGIVNAQLREQAEAAVKDKIATMSVEEVLNDKKPIIAELTTRLKEVAEKQSQAESPDEGLGIKIVTVQIREALVSSQRLWQDLQAPFRHEQEKTARISLLQMQDEISQKELQTRQATETREAETMVEIERIKQSKQTEAISLKFEEESTRFSREQAAEQQRLAQAEQTSLAKQESEERLAEKATSIEHDRRLAEMQRQQAQTLAQSRLQQEIENQQKSLEIEQELHLINEESRLAEQRVQAEQTRLAQERLLGQQQAESEAEQQRQADALADQIQVAKLGRRKTAHQTKLHEQEAANQLELAYLERQVELLRLKQEARNQMNERELLSQLIEKLPEIAAEMPDIEELRVLQTGEGDPSFDSLTTFVSKIFALADSLGISLPKK